LLTPPAGNCLSVLLPAGIEGLVGVGGISKPSSQDWVFAGAAALSGVCQEGCNPALNVAAADVRHLQPLHLYERASCQLRTDGSAAIQISPDHGAHVM
jgi:hypothetical protein